VRRALAMTAIAAVPLACLALAPMSEAGASSPFGSGAATPFDAYIASGDASCLELTVNVSGYSFIVQPDARVPRATASISEGESGALAAPADPGDSVDALAGLLIPREEGQIAGGIDGALAQTKIPFPLDVGNTLLSVANPVNPHLEYPIEHASAAYPDPTGSPGDQESKFLGAPNASFRDPTGVISADGTAGDAKAGAAYATADAGAGAATSVSALGVSAGRIASHALSQVSATAVTNDVSCTLHDVTIAPPGSGRSLHIGTLAATLHTERTLSGNRAASRRTLQLADVTLNGKNLIAAGGGDIALPPGVPGTITVPQPPPCTSLPLPCSSLPQPPVSLQSMSLGGTTHTETLGAANNEDTSAMTAATVTLQTTAPVPSSIPPSGSGNPITAAPTTYTLQLANLDSSAYGLPSASPLLTNPSFGGVPGLGAFGGVTQNLGLGSPGTPGTRPVASTITIPGIAAAIRWPVVALAALMESLLLTSLLLRRRRMADSLHDASPSAFLDMP